MKLKKTVLALAAATFAVAGCAGNSYRPNVISDTTVSRAVIDGEKRTQGGPVGSAYPLFIEAAKNAYPKSITDSVDPDAQRLFMETGFDLVKDRCRVYLARKADNQRSVNVWRDSFAPLTGLLTGVIGLVDSGDTIDNDLLAAVGIGTTAATAAIEIYEERFLFNAENVDSVQELLDKALTVDAEEKLSLPDSSMRYTKSLNYIASNQLICSPQRILRLVKEAIADGKVVPRSGNKIERDEDGNPKIKREGDGFSEPQGVTIAPN